MSTGSEKEQDKPPVVSPRLGDTFVLAQLIKGYHYRFSDEKKLQDGLALVFDRSKVGYRREHALAPGDVIDFLCEGGIGVEVKVGGGLSEVTRQLHRYAAHASIEALILVSSRSRLDNLPSTLRGKPLQVVVINGAFHA